MARFEETDVSLMILHRIGHEFIIPTFKAPPAPNNGMKRLQAFAGEKRRVKALSLAGSQRPRIRNSTLPYALYLACAPILVRPAVRRSI